VCFFWCCSVLASDLLFCSDQVSCPDLGFFFFVLGSHCKLDVDAVRWLRLLIYLRVFWSDLVDPSYVDLGFLAVFFHADLLLCSHFSPSVLFVGGPLLWWVFLMHPCSPSKVTGSFRIRCIPSALWVWLHLFWCRVSDLLQQGFGVLDPLFLERYVCRSDLVCPALGLLWGSFYCPLSAGFFRGSSHTRLQFLSLVVLVCSGFDVCPDDRGASYRSDLVHLVSSVGLFRV
jgi:hypothetical protein